MVTTSEAHICQRNTKEVNSASTSQVNIPEICEKESSVDNKKSTFEPVRRGSSSNRESDAEDDKPLACKDVQNVHPTCETYNSVEPSQSDSLTLQKIFHHASENSKSFPAFQAATNKQKARPSFLFIPNESVSEEFPSKGATESEVEATALDVQETQSKPCILELEKSPREIDISSEGNKKFSSLSRTIIINTPPVADSQYDSKASSGRSSKTRVGKTSTVTGTSRSMGKITKTTKNNLHSAPELSIQNTRHNNTNLKDTNQQIINSKTVTYLDSEDTHFIQEQVKPFTPEDSNEGKLSDGSIPKAKSNICAVRRQIDSSLTLKRKKSSSLADKEGGSHVTTMAKRNSFVGTNKSNALLKSHVKPSCEEEEMDQMIKTIDIKNKSDSQRINEISTKFPDIAKMTLKRLVTSTPKLSDINGSWQTCTTSYSSLRRPVSQKTSQKKNNEENGTKIEVKNLVRSESYVIVGKCNNNQKKNERASENSFPRLQNVGKKSQITTSAKNQAVIQKQSNFQQQSAPSEQSRNEATLPDVKRLETKPSARNIAASKSLSKAEPNENDKTEIIIHPTIQAIRSKMRLIEKTRREVERLSQATREIIKESWADDITLSDDQINNIVQLKILEDEQSNQNISYTSSPTYVDMKHRYKSHPPVVESKRGKYIPRKALTAVKRGAPKNSPGANKYTSVTNNRDYSKPKIMSHSKSHTLSRTQSMSKTMSRSSSGSSRTIKSFSQTSSVKSSRPKAFLSSSNVQEKSKPSVNFAHQPSTAANTTISNIVGVLSLINSPPKTEKNYIQLNIIRAREKQPRSKVFGRKQSKTTTKSKASFGALEPKETKTSPTVNTAEYAENINIIRTSNEQTKQPFNAFVKKQSDIIINLPNLSSMFDTGNSKRSYTSHKVITTPHKPVSRTLQLSRVPASMKFTPTISNEKPAVSLRSGREWFSNEKVSKRESKPSDKSMERTSFSKESNQNKMKHEILLKNDNIQSVTKTFITSHVNESKVLYHSPRQISPVSSHLRKTSDVCKRENVKNTEKVQTEMKTTRKNVMSSDESVRAKRIPSRSKDEVDDSMERKHLKNNKSLVARVSRKSGNLKLPGSRDASMASSHDPSTLNKPENEGHRSSTPDAPKPKHQNFDFNSSQKKDNYPRSRGSDKKLSQYRTRYTAPDLREMRAHDTSLTEVEHKKVISASEVVGKLVHTEPPRFGKSGDLMNKTRTLQTNPEELSAGWCTMPPKGKTTETTRRVDSSRLKNTLNITSKFSSVTRAKTDCGQNSERRIKKRDSMRTDDSKTSDAKLKKEDIYERRSRSRTPITFTKLVENPDLVESTQIDSNLIGKTKQSQAKMGDASKLEYSVNAGVVQTSGEVREKTASSFSRRSMTSSSIFQKDHYRKRDGSFTSTKTMNNSSVVDGKTRMSIRNGKSGVNDSLENTGQRKDLSPQILRRTSNTNDLPEKEESVSKSRATFNTADTNIQHQQSKRFRYPSSKLRGNVTGKASIASDITNNVQTVTVHSQHKINQEFSTVSPDIKYNVTETADTAKSTFRKHSKEWLKNEVQGPFQDTPDFVLDATGANPTNANVVALSIEEFPYTQHPTKRMSIQKLTSSQRLKCPVGSMLQNTETNDDALVIGDISQGIAVIIRPKSKVLIANESKESQNISQNTNDELKETWDDKISQGKTIPLIANQDSQLLSSETSRDIDKRLQNTREEIIMIEGKSNSLNDCKIANIVHFEELNRQAISSSLENLESSDTNDIQDSGDSISYAPLDTALKNEREESEHKEAEPHSDQAIRHPLVRAITLLTRNRTGGNEGLGSPTEGGSTTSLTDIFTTSDSERN